MAKSNKNVIVESVAKAQQDVYFQRIEILPDNRKLKFDVRSNTFEFQGHAHVYLWHDASSDWKRIHSIFPLEMKTDHGLCYFPKEKQNAEAFAADVAELRRVALAVIA